jgi:hypothetical protein
MSVRDLNPKPAESVFGVRRGSQAFVGVRSAWLPIWLPKVTRIVPRAAKANEVIYTFRTVSRTSREDELVMQIRQIVGYESDQSLVAEGEGRYKMDLHRPLTPIDEHRLEELAIYNGVQMELRNSHL